MKKILFAAAIAALAFASCQKDDNNGQKPDVKQAQVAIKLAGVVKTTKTVAPGKKDVGTIQLTNGQVYVVDASGVIVYHEALDITKAIMTDGTGQILGQDVPSDARIYILGNIPAGSDVLGVTDGSTTLAQLQAMSDDMTEIVVPSTGAVTDAQPYMYAPLANDDGLAKQITTNGVTDEDPQTGDTVIEATVTIALSPLTSRIELGKVTGDTDILGFNVIGVYVDSWAPQFAYGTPYYKGDVFAQDTHSLIEGEDTYQADPLGEAGIWAAVAATNATGENVYQATAGTDLVWGYDVAAGVLPRLIIVLNNVQYMSDTDGDEATAPVLYTDPATLYLTVTGYNAGALTAFERGHIYNIGGDTDQDGITFGPGDTHLTPNASEVTLQVNVTITEWTIEYPDANL